MSAANPAVDRRPVTWRNGLLGLGCLGLALGIFHDGLAQMAGEWVRKEEYSHGVLIPLVSAFLVWQKKNELARMPFRGSWWGVVLVGLGLALFVLGELATLYVIVQYAFLVVLAGLVLALLGPEVFRGVGFALAFLFFAIPLPSFIYQGLSTRLQLWSSWLGVSLIRACDISVYLEGNVIDLGAYQLQVVEACSGLRYLFPLMSLGFICAYFYRAAFWKRAVIFLSSIPITVFMNSFRIAVIGILVEYGGTAMAEGFLHDFEGWIVFMACIAILLAEMAVLARIGRNPRPFREVFAVAWPEPLAGRARLWDGALPPQSWAALVLLLAVGGLALSLERRAEIIPERRAFAEFPLHLADWRGRRDRMPAAYVETLKFDDYLLADFVPNGDFGKPPVNLYSAYYASQRKGESVHSPRSCIPGGGWQIKSLETVALPEYRLYASPLRVNRVLIQKGGDRQLVYYWFQQRGRGLTNEYLVKWFLFWDALTKNRTDGALVRVTTYVPETGDLADAERRLTAFIGVVLPELGRHIAD
jgi:exosortase D (VPLPA-CTERM-specific)